jgi:hypothetical protein
LEETMSDPFDPSAPIPGDDMEALLAHAERMRRKIEAAVGIEPMSKLDRFDEQMRRIEQAALGGIDPSEAAEFAQRMARAIDPEVVAMAERYAHPGLVNRDPYAEIRSASYMPPTPPPTPAPQITVNITFRLPEDAVSDAAPTKPDPSKPN